MTIYLPIAELSMNFLLIISLGLMVGVLSGMFGVGGGFLMTPLLIFIGIPPSIAVGTEAMQISGSSISGVFTHFKRDNIDLKLGILLAVGGFFGATLGVQLFSIAMEYGLIDLIIAFGFLIFLGSIGSLMLVESAIIILVSRKIIKRKKKKSAKKSNPTMIKKYLDMLPWQSKFVHSNKSFSVLLPLIIGFFVGILSSIMGVGGGFILVPALIYLLQIPTIVAIGTSLLQVVFVTSVATFLHAYKNMTVDIVLGALLLIGGVIGAQLGLKFSRKFKSEELRILLALLVLSVCIKFAFDVFIEPENLFIISKSEMGH